MGKKKVKSKCQKCNSISFVEISLPAKDGLPRVRGIKCEKCDATYWCVADSIRYQDVKEKKCQDKA